jgi:RimJ/RimL family protein N-acetyltransferase
LAVDGVTAGEPIVRELELSEVSFRIDYFLDASDEYLQTLGVGRARLPEREAWLAHYEYEFSLPIRERESYLLAWELDGELVGFSTADPFTFGSEAFMHLHIRVPNRRGSGLGVQFTRRSAALYFSTLELECLYCQPNAFNVAPNRTLQKAGFRYVQTFIDQPHPINFRQPLTRWVLERSMLGRPA